MIITSDEFFWSGKITRWVITDDMADCLKELKPNFIEGYYVDRCIEYNIDDNKVCLDKFRKDIKAPEFMSNLAISMQLILRSVRIDDIPIYFINKLKIKDHHVDLLNQLYLDFDEEESINSGDKRPFGNSSIEADIISTWKKRCGGESEWEDFYEKNKSEVWKIYNTVLDLATIILSKRLYKFRVFVKISLEDYNKCPEYQRQFLRQGWCPDISEFREQKIDKILE